MLSGREAPVCPAGRPGSRRPSPDGHRGCRESGGEQEGGRARVQGHRTHEQERGRPRNAGRHRGHAGALAGAGQRWRRAAGPPRARHSHVACAVAARPATARRDTGARPGDDRPRPEHPGRPGPRRLPQRPGRPAPCLARHPRDRPRRPGRPRPRRGRRPPAPGPRARRLRRRAHHQRHRLRRLALPSVTAVRAASPLLGASPTRPRRSRSATALPATSAPPSSGSRAAGTSPPRTTRTSSPRRSARRTPRPAAVADPVHRPLSSAT